MKLKKAYSFSDKNQVWRILLTDTEKLIVETRDTEKKEAFFSVLDLFTGKKIITKYQLNEKYWVSIEATYKDIILFHKFTKPDLPGHKQIIAFDITTQKIIWEKINYVLMFVNEKGIYVYENTMAGNKYYLLNHNTGEIVDTLTWDDSEALTLSREASNVKDYSDYCFPEKYLNDDSDVILKELKEMIFAEIKGLEIVGSVEYVNYGKLLFFNYHNRVSQNNLVNKFVVKETNFGKKIFDMILNLNVNAYASDSFFIYKNLLLLLKEKKEVIVFNILE